MEHDRTPLTPLARRCIAGGASLMALGVALGAFAAHGLQGQLTPRQLASFQTGVQYQLLHALGLLLLGVVARATGGTRPSSLGSSTDVYP